MRPDTSSLKSVNIQYANKGLAAVKHKWEKPCENLVILATAVRIKLLSAVLAAAVRIKLLSAVLAA